MTADVKNLSHFGWLVLNQLRQQGRVWDGDLVCKSGRTELVHAGLAERHSGYQWLTSKGRTLAAQYAGDQSRVRS